MRRFRSVRTDAPALAEHIVGRALEKDCGLRYQRASDVATDLKRLVRDLEPASVGSGVRAEVRLRRRGRVAVLAGAAGLVVVLAIAYCCGRRRRLRACRNYAADARWDAEAGRGSGPPTDMLDGWGCGCIQLQSLSEAAVMQVSTEGGEAERVRLPFQMAGLVTCRRRSRSCCFRDRRLNEPGYGNAVDDGGAGRTAATDRESDGVRCDVGSGRGADLLRGGAGDPGGAERWQRGAEDLAVHGQPYWIRFSHDGQMIRFSSWDEKLNTNSLWEARADGSGLRRTLEGWNPSPNECCGAWMPDGRYFVLLRRAGARGILGDSGEAGRWRKTNPEPVQLTVGQMSSPDSAAEHGWEEIFFIGASPRGELERYDAGKSCSRRICRTFCGGAGVFADGSRLAYVTVPDGTLWQSKADGNGSTRADVCPDAGGGARGGRPDGTQIAFTGREPGKSWAIYLVSPEGGNPERLTAGENDDLDPSWSPNGDALAYGGSSPSRLSSKKHPIQILNLKSRAVTALPDSGGYHAPRWSTDGGWLVAVDGDVRGLALYDFTSHTWEELTTKPAVYPNWSPDWRVRVFQKKKKKTNSFSRGGDAGFTRRFLPEKGETAKRRRLVWLKNLGREKAGGGGELLLATGGGVSGAGGDRGPGFGMGSVESI